MQIKDFLHLSHFLFQDSPEIPMAAVDLSSGLQEVGHAVNWLNVLIGPQAKGLEYL